MKTTLTLMSSALLAACASSAVVDVPATLKPGANESLAMIVPAKGVQIYECRAAKDASGRYEWAFVAPDAALFDVHGKSIGHHGAGPYWEAKDGSRIVGALKQRVDAPMPGAIPWLLLTTKSNGPEGSFSKVGSVQRVRTVGGVAPESGCTAGRIGSKARVPYAADYYFFTQQ